MEKVYRLNPPAATARRKELVIVGLGDSTTAGTPGFFSPLEAPPAGRGDPESQYAYWMMKVHGDWRVLNRGINGQRSDEILARFQRDVQSVSPEFVIILAGVNDVYQVYDEDFTKENLRSMYSIAREASIVPVAATILPYNLASAEESGTIHRINSWIQATATEFGISFCDTNFAVRDKGNPNLLRSTRDGLHPDVDGYRRMGEALAKTIELALL